MQKCMNRSIEVWFFFLFIALEPASNQGWGQRNHGTPQSQPLLSEFKLVTAPVKNEDIPYDPCGEIPVYKRLIFKSLFIIKRGFDFSQCLCVRDINTLSAYVKRIGTLWLNPRRNEWKVRETWRFFSIDTEPSNNQGWSRSPCGMPQNQHPLPALNLKSEQTPANPHGKLNAYVGSVSPQQTSLASPEPRWDLGLKWTGLWAFGPHNLCSFHCFAPLGCGILCLSSVAILH